MNGDFSEKLSQVLSNPAMMAQIKALADTMTESSTKEETAPSKEPPHIETPESVSLPAFFTPSPTFEKNMQNTCALLYALKPFLDEKRCAKIDKMLSMIRFAEMAGKFGNFL